MLAVGGVVPAAAHDHFFPRVSLNSGGRVQMGEPFSGYWIDRGPYGCNPIVLDGAALRRARLTLTPGAPAKVRFHKPRRPQRVFVDAYEVGPSGNPRGEPIPLDFRLEPGRRDGRVTSWRAVLELPPDPDHYLTVYATWRDYEGCPGRQELAVYFRVRG